MKLNLGSGRDIKEGFINVDLHEPKAEIHHDLDDYPWPFEDNSIDYVYIKDVLEHTHKPELIIREMIRIMKPGSEAFIQVPHYSHKASYMNLGHTHHFHEQALNICVSEGNSDSSMPIGFKIIETKVKRNRFRIWKKQSIRWKIRKDYQKN